MVMTELKDPTHYCPKCGSEQDERIKLVKFCKWGRVVDVFCISKHYYGRFYEYYQHTVKHL